MMKKKNANRVVLWLSGCLAVFGLALAQFDQNLSQIERYLRNRQEKINERTRIQNLEINIERKKDQLEQRRLQEIERKVNHEISLEKKKDNIFKQLEELNKLKSGQKGGSQQEKENQKQLEKKIFELEKQIKEIEGELKTISEIDKKNKGDSDRQENILKMQQKAADALGKNLDIKISLYDLKMDWQIGRHFDAYGVEANSLNGQLEELIAYLEDGVDREIKSLPLAVAPEDKKNINSGKGTLSGEAYRGGSFILVSAPDTSLPKSGIRFVIVAPVFYTAIEQLKNTFTEVEFLKAEEAEQILKDEVNKI